MRAQCLSPLHCPLTYVQAQTLLVRVLESAEAAMAAAAVTMPVRNAEPGPFAFCRRRRRRSVPKWFGWIGADRWARWGLETDRGMWLQGVGVKKSYRSG